MSYEITPWKRGTDRIGSNGTYSKTEASRSTAVSSFSEGNWWTKEEARLYEEWASSLSKYNEAAPNPYFDYFYTGQDIRVKIDALDDNEYLPVYSFGYQVQQQKQPVYGYASYVYDAMLRGTRIVSGAFSIAVTEPFLLTSQIAKSADLRARSSQAYSAYALRHFDGDQENINRYWRRTYDTGLDVGDRHLFSIHPPFNFLIKFGIQETGLVGKNPAARVNDIKENFDLNSSKFTNTNERLVENTTARKIHILLENIELTSKSTEYDPSGDPILETYTFIARDERLVDDSSTMNVPAKITPFRPTNPGAGGNSNIYV